MERDRLARSVDLCGFIITTVERAGGEVLILDELDAPPILELVMLMVSEIERELARQRTRIAMRELRARGIHVGRTPFGWQLGDDGKLVPLPDEIEIVREVVAMRREGSTLAQIAAWLTGRGIAATRRGGRWSAEQVRSMLQQADRQKVQPSSATAA